VRVPLPPVIDGFLSGFLILSIHILFVVFHHPVSLHRQNGFVHPVKPFSFVAVHTKAGDEYDSDEDEDENCDVDVQNVLLEEMDLILINLFPDLGLFGVVLKANTDS
jgi:hypothetical protein